jgi:hypothetical protein
VIWHEIKNDLESNGMRRQEQIIEICKRTEHGRDIAVVRDIITKVSHRRGVDRRYPYCVDPEINEVSKPAGDAFEVADSVPVGILKRSRINLVDNPRLPPRLHWIHVSAWDPDKRSSCRLRLSSPFVPKLVCW